MHAIYPIMEPHDHPTPGPLPGLATPREPGRLAKGISSRYPSRRTTDPKGYHNLFLGHLFQYLEPSKVTIPLARRPAAHLGCRSTNRVTLSDRPRDRLVSQLVLWGINLRPSHRDPSQMQIYFLPSRSQNSSALQAFTMRASAIIALALCAFAGTAMAQSFPHCSSSALQIVNQKLTLCTGALTSNSTSCDTTCRVVLAEVRG